MKTVSLLFYAYLTLILGVSLLYRTSYISLSPPPLSRAMGEEGRGNFISGYRGEIFFQENIHPFQLVLHIS